jgi:hypothetical protein
MRRFDQLVFDHGTWHYDLIEALGSFRQLRRFTQDHAALRAHLHGAGRPQRVFSTGLVAGVEDHDVERFVQPVSASIATAMSVYRRQLIVVMVSILEEAVAEAFAVLFAHRPDTIKGLAKEPTRDGFSPTIPIDELVNATSLDGLRMSLVERAVAQACQGKNKRTVLRRLSQFFADDLDVAAESAFVELVERRNVIVHENSKQEIADAEVEQAFDAALNFVRELGRLVCKRSLPINDPLQVCDK